MIAWGPRLKDPLQMWRWGKVLFSWRSSTGCEPSLSHRSSNEIQVYSDECVCVEHLNRCQTSTWWCRFWLFVLFSFFSLRDALSTSTAVFNFNIHFRAGGRSVMESLLPTKTLTTDGDTRLGQSGVPALVWSPVVQGLLPFNFHFLTMRRVSTQEPPWRFVQFSALLSQSVNLFHLALILAIVSSRSFLGSFHRPIPVRYNWSVFARKMHSTSEFAKIVLSKCVCVYHLNRCETSALTSFYISIFLFSSLQGGTEGP